MNAKSEGMLKLSDYLLSENTGAVLEGNLEKLPNYFNAWNILAEQFVYFYQEKRLRDEIQKLPLLDHTKLSNHQERVLAHLQLSLFCTGYIFQDENTATVLPKSVAVPLCGVSESLGVLPYTAYFSLVLGNVVIKNSERPVTMNNLRTIFMLPTNKEWCYFVENTGEVESCAGPMYSAMLTGLEAVEKNDEDKLTECLTVIKQGLDKMKDVFKLLNDGCSTTAFFNGFSKFFTGSGKDQPNPNGIIFEGVSEIPKEFIGTNAAQTPTFQIIDGFLGIEHTEHNEARFEFLKTYMLPLHRSFIEEIRKRSKVKQFVTTRENRNLTDVYHECLSSLTNFRNYHIQIFTRYFINQLGPEQRRNFADDKPGPMSFLKAVRDTTKTSDLN